VNLKISIFLTAFILISSSLHPSWGVTVETCDRYKSVIVGSYVVNTGYWNQEKCPGTQCLKVDDQTGNFTVTEGNYQCGDAYSVATYPSIIYGHAWGAQSLHSLLPAKVGDLQSVKSSWSFVPASTGRWDAAYDIWLSPSPKAGGTDGFNGGAEVMIWLDYQQTNGWKYDRGPVNIGGIVWEVWEWDLVTPTENHKYVAYLAKTMTTSVKNLDVKKFLDDCQSRGFIKPSWYLYAVEAGCEIHSGGIPFTSQGFSVAPVLVKP